MDFTGSFYPLNDFLYNMASIASRESAPTGN